MSGRTCGKQPARCRFESYPANRGDRVLTWPGKCTNEISSPSKKLYHFVTPRVRSTPWRWKAALEGNMVRMRNPNPKNNGSDKGPLRKIVKRIRAGEGIFDRDWVLLECGHEGTSAGGVRARCRECKKLSPAPAVAGGRSGPGTAAVERRISCQSS